MTAIANPTAVINFFAPDRLGELKKVLARKFVADARANGFGVKSVQSVLDANSDPEDIGSFGIKRQNSFKTEAEARAAGMRDGDVVNINGQQFRLAP
jgi:hypothetical protein